jgi:O-antigen/teichoic acid export membrane protein
MTTDEGRQTSFRAALFYSGGSRYFILGIEFLASLLLARLLAPEDFGIYSVAVVFAGLAQILRDFGVANYVVQEAKLTPTRLRAAITVSLIGAWSLAFALLAAADPISAIYETPAIRDVLQVLVLNLVLTPFGAVTLAYLRRERHFRAYFTISAASTIVRLATNIALAVAGAGYMSLAWAAVAGTLASVVGAMIARPPQVPRLPGLRELPQVLSFSWKAAAVDLVGHLGNTAPDWIMGKTIGMEAVALFSRAQGLPSLFSRAIMDVLRPVVGPHFAQREQADLKKPYVYAVFCLTGIAWPFYANLALFALPTIRLLYGEQWVDAAPLLSWWCASSAVYALVALTDTVLMGLGHAGGLLRVQPLLQGTRIAVVMVSSHWGLEAVVISLLLVVSPIRLVLYQRLLARHLGVSLRDYVPVVWRGLTVTGMSLLAPALLLVTGWSAQVPPPVSLLLAVAGAGIGWAGGLLLFRHPLTDELVRVFHRVPGFRDDR